MKHARRVIPRPARS